MAEAPKKVCKSCGYSYAEDDGRQHGACFTCTQCRNIASVIRRNLGTTADIAQWTKDETHDFFRSQQKDAADGRLKWTTIRAAWVKKRTEAVIRKFTATVEKEALPKTVWQKRGWEDAVIDRFEPKWSDEYGTHVKGCAGKKRSKRLRSRCWSKRKPQPRRRVAKAQATKT